MKQIEKLLAEYKIRFRDTDRILEKGYPFKFKRISNDKADCKPYISDDCIFTKKGNIYFQGVWATADIKIKPFKWVVEKDEGNPLWGKFKKWWNSEDIYDFSEAFKESLFFSEHTSHTYIYVFKNHQYLTIDQWYNLIYLPEQSKVDFSIINDKDWFYIKHFERPFLFKGGNPFVKHVVLFDIYEKILRCRDGWVDGDIRGATILKQATPEDLAPLYKVHPELEPPKVGDLCVFSDESDDKLKRLGILNEIRNNPNIVCKYRDTRGAGDWEYAMKILPTWGYDEILERYEIYKKVML